MVHLCGYSVLFLLNLLVLLLHLGGLDLQLLLELLEVSLLLLYYRVAFNYFLLALLKLFFHLFDLVLVD